MILGMLWQVPIYTYIPRYVYISTSTYTHMGLSRTADDTASVVSCSDRVVASVACEDEAVALRHNVLSAGSEIVLTTIVELNPKFPTPPSPICFNYWVVRDHASRLQTDVFHGMQYASVAPKPQLEQVYRRIP